MEQLLILFNFLFCAWKIVAFVIKIIFNTSSLLLRIFIIAVKGTVLKFKLNIFYLIKLHEQIQIHKEDANCNNIHFHLI